MEVRYVLSEYVEEAMAQAAYDKLEDGTFTGRISASPGVVAFGVTLRACQEELRSTLEEWILVGLRMGHRLPRIADIDLNQELTREPMGYPVNAATLSANCVPLVSKDPSQVPDISS